MVPMFYLEDEKRWVNLAYVIDLDEQAQRLTLDRRARSEDVYLSVADCDALSRAYRVATSPPAYVVTPAPERPEGVNWDLIDEAFKEG